MVIFWFLQPGLFLGSSRGPGIVFYLWVGMFGVFVVAQFWTFCADLYTDERGKRMLPLIAIGATSGAARRIVDPRELLTKCGPRSSAREYAPARRHRCRC